MIARLLAWLGRDKEDAELDEELRAHLAMAAADGVARGESPSDALAGARRELGNVGHIKEVTRESWGRTWLDVALQDLQYAARALRRSPAFTIVAVATLALGIGVNTAMFTIVNGIVLRPLAYASSGRVVALARNDGVNLAAAISDHTYAAFTDHDVYRGALDRVATFENNTSILLDGGRPINVAAVGVTKDFFAVFDLPPASGRTFDANDPEGFRDHAVVLSDRLWRWRYNADPNIVGKLITVDSVRRQVVGVMPAAFDFPAQTDLWYPFTPVVHPNRTWSRPVVGRIAQNLPFDAAQTRWAAIANRLPRDEDNPRAGPPVLVPLQKFVIGETDRSLFIYAAAVGLVLLIACVNVANLLLMRVTTRDREMAVRAALGAGRSRIMRQLLTESFLLSIGGATLGVLTAIVVVKGFVAATPPSLLPRMSDVHVDWHVLLFAFGATIVTTLACGVAPSLHAAEPRLQSALTNGARTATGRHRRMRSILAGVQIALAVVLVAAAGLLIRSFANMTSVNVGFTPEHMYTIGVTLPMDRYRSSAQMRAFHQQAVGALAALPGVESAGMANWLPFTGLIINGPVVVEGRQRPIDEHANRVQVTPSYFRALGLPVVAGRAFTDADRLGAEPVAIITRSMAKAYWADGNAIGKRISTNPEPAANDWLRVVGVVEDVVQNNVTEDHNVTVYRPMLQTDFPFFLQTGNYIVRASRPTAQLAERMRAALLAIDPILPPRDVVSMESLIDGTMLTPRFQWRLFVAFSSIALALALIGVYGVLAYSVAQTRREIGVRLALGATASDVERRVIAGSGAIVVPGIIVGVVASLAVARVLRGYLFQVAPNDPATLGAVAGIVCLVALVAAYVPAKRAGEVDPIIALRED
jgi:predicted permease